MSQTSTTSSPRHLPVPKDMENSHKWTLELSLFIQEKTQDINSLYFMLPCIQEKKSLELLSIVSLQISLLKQSNSCAFFLSSFEINNKMQGARSPQEEIKMLLVSLDITYLFVRLSVIPTLTSLKEWGCRVR